MKVRSNSELNKELYQEAAEFVITPSSAPTSDYQVANKKYVDGSNHGFKNYIINGGFDVWQRGTSFTGLGAANNYTADRFVARTYGTNGTVNVTKVSSVTISTPLLRFETVNTDGLGAYYIEQRVENPSQFKNKTMTFSAKVRNVSGYSGKNIKIDIYLLTTTGYVYINTSLATLSLTNEFQTISGTNTFDNMSSYVFDESSHLLFRLELEDNNINGTIDITQVQLEEGSVATPFEQRPYGLELSLCQRYFEKSYQDNISPGSASWEGALTIPPSSTARQAGAMFKISKRTTPTVVIYAPSTGATAVCYRSGNYPSTLPVNEGMYGFRLNVSGGISTSDDAGYHFTADAEL